MGVEVRQVLIVTVEDGAACKARGALPADLKRVSLGDVDRAVWQEDGVGVVPVARNRGRTGSTEPPIVFTSHILPIKLLMGLFSSARDYVTDHPSLVTHAKPDHLNSVVAIC